MHARTSPTPFTRLWSITDIITERARTWLCPTTIYYSIKREKREILEREERETYKREKREILEGDERERRTEREDKQARSPRERKEKGVWLGTERVLWHSCWKSRTSFIIRILWTQLF